MQSGCINISLRARFNDRFPTLRKRKHHSRKKETQIKSTRYIIYVFLRRYIEPYK